MIVGFSLAGPFPDNGDQLGKEASTPLPVICVKVYMLQKLQQHKTLPPAWFEETLLAKEEQRELVKAITA